MGRAKMDLMKSEKLRSAAFMKRKKGLKKKIYEFSTLCGVDACMIVFDGSNDDSNNPNHRLLNKQDEVYPENRGELLRIIHRFQSSDKQGRSKRSVNFSDDLFEDRKKKMEGDIDRINSLDQHQLTELLRSLDSKIDQISNAKVRLTEGSALIECSPGARDQNSFTDAQDIWRDPMFAEPLSYMNPVVHQMPSVDSSSDLSLCFSSSDLSLGFDCVPTNGFECDNLDAGPTWSFDTWPDLYHHHSSCRQQQVNPWSDLSCTWGASDRMSLNTSGCDFQNSVQELGFWL